MTDLFETRSIGNHTHGEEPCHTLLLVRDSPARQHQATAFTLASLLFGSFTFACTSACSLESPPAHAEQRPGGAAAPQSDSSENRGKKADPTPEVIAKAEALLKSHGDKPIGTEIPFRLNGKRYVARVEEHDNPDNDPSRPAGKHKGITVYDR